MTAMNKPALDWTDATARDAWLDDTRGRINDLFGVAEDQAAPVAKRRLGRVGARELLREVSRILDQQFAYAARGLSDEEPPSSDPAVRIDMAPGLPDATDTASCRVWLATLRAHCLDAIGVAEDLVRPYRKRRLGPAAAVQLLGEASFVVEHLCRARDRDVVH